MRPVQLSTHLKITVWLLAVFLAAECLTAVQDSETKTDGLRTLYLIRHGDYDHQDTRDPDVHRALVPLGIAQARLVAARLRSLPVRMTSLHSSTMTRARQTAAVIGADFPDLKLETSTLIRECTPPSWRRDIIEGVDAEELTACRVRLEAAFAAYFTPSPAADRHDIVVCHGNVIRYFVTRVLQVDHQAWLGMSIGNCSLTIVRIAADGAMTLVAFNDLGHSPPNLQTSTGDINPEIRLRVPEGEK